MWTLGASTYVDTKNCLICGHKNFVQFMDANRPHMWTLASFPHNNMWTVTCVDSTSIYEERNLDMNMISVILWKNTDDIFANAKHRNNSLIN